MPATRVQRALVIADKLELLTQYIHMGKEDTKAREANLIEQIQEMLEKLKE